MERRKFSIVCALIFATGVLSEDTYTDHRGKEFVFGFFENTNRLPALIVIITSQLDAAFNITNDGFSYHVNGTVAANETLRIEIDPNYYYEGDMDVLGRAFHLEATEDVSVYCVTTGYRSAGGYLAIPVEKLNTSYIAVSYDQIYRDTNYTTSGKLRSAFVIFATEDSTKVVVSFKTADGGTCGNGVVVGGDKKVFVLNRNEAVGAYCTSDLTGTLISASKKVAVVSGNVCAEVPNGTVCDHLLEMLIPVYHFGHTFSLHQISERRSAGSYYRVIAAENNTLLIPSTLITVTLNELEFVTYDTLTTGPFCLHSTKPVLVVMFAKGQEPADTTVTGGAFMATVPAINQYGTFYMFSTNVRFAGQFGSSFVTVTVAKEHGFGFAPEIFRKFVVTGGCQIVESSAALDGNSDHTVTRTDGVRFGALVYGFYNEEAYGFLAGMDFGYSCKRIQCTPDLNYFKLAETRFDCWSGPCRNSGLCLHLRKSVYLCNCHPDVFGTFCEHDTVDNCIGNNCTLHGTCADGIGTYYCVCQPGFTGVYCESDIDECINSPCQNGDCQNSFGNYTCFCNDGYTGYNCDINIDECSSDPCKNGGTCIDKINHYNCTCSSGFTGVNCESDIDECVTSPCENGVCLNNIGNYSCLCADGYTGINCEINIDECSSDPCANGGTCTDDVNKYNCTCASGFTGVNCDIDIDECASSPCLYGTCQDKIAHYECLCNEGFTGNNCNIIDACISKPCQNNGTCVNNDGNYTCSCVPGYSGDSCEENIDECSSNPCQNGGTCTDDVNKYKCTCVSGFTGVNCDIDINECSSSPCQNGARCIDDVNQYRCACVSGYTGVNCETDIKECSSDPCQNGGSCIEDVNMYSCNCRSGYKGVNCETDVNECFDQPCENGGSCGNYYGGYMCLCEPGYKGKNCHEDVDECIQQPCQNRGACTNTVGSYTCLCQPGYTGVHCETYIGRCVSDPCLNGGICREDGEDYKCDCVPGYTGINCEKVSGAEKCFSDTVCRCVARNNTTEMLHDLLNKLTINKRVLSRAIRKRVSIYDDRPSATYLGVGGIVFIAMSTLLIVVMDLFPGRIGKLGK